MTRRVLLYAALTAVALGVFHLVYAFVGPEPVYLVTQAFVAAAATTFTIVYHATARWWVAPIGRNIMLLVGSIAAILDLGLIFNLLGRPVWMRELFAVLFAAIGVAIWRRLFILIDAQYHTPDHIDIPRPTDQEAPDDRP